MKTHEVKQSSHVNSNTSSTPFFSKSNEGSVINRKEEPFFSPTKQDNKPAKEHDLPSDAKISLAEVHRSTIITDLSYFLSEEKGVFLSKIDNIDKLQDDIDSALRGETSVVYAEINETGMSINDRITIRFSIKYSNSEKTKFNKSYNEGYEKQSERTTENGVKLGIEEEGVGADFETKTTNKGSNKKNSEKSQIYNVYNADFKVEVSYAIDYEGPVDMFNNDREITKVHSSRGTIETLNDKLHLY